MAITKFTPDALRTFQTLLKATPVVWPNAHSAGGSAIQHNVKPTLLTIKLPEGFGKTNFIQWKKRPPNPEQSSYELCLSNSTKRAASCCAAFGPARVEYPYFYSLKDDASKSKLPLHGLKLSEQMRARVDEQLLHAWKASQDWSAEQLAYAGIPSVQSIRDAADVFDQDRLAVVKWKVRWAVLAIESSKLE